VNITPEAQHVVDRSARLLDLIGKILADAHAWHDWMETNNLMPRCDAEMDLDLSICDYENVVEGQYP